MSSNHAIEEDEAKKEALDDLCLYMVSRTIESLCLVVESFPNVRNSLLCTVASATKVALPV